jgi:hypothetical protein
MDGRLTASLGLRIYGGCKADYQFSASPSSSFLITYQPSIHLALSSRHDGSRRRPEFSYTSHQSLPPNTYLIVASQIPVPPPHIRSLLLLVRSPLAPPRELSSASSGVWRAGGWPLVASRRPHAHARCFEDGALVVML